MNPDSIRIAIFGVRSTDAINPDSIRIEVLVRTHLNLRQGNPTFCRAFSALAQVARETYETEVIAVDAPTPKRRRLTDYFPKLPLNTEAQEFPQYLKHGS